MDLLPVFPQPVVRINPPGLDTQNSKTSHDQPSSLLAAQGGPERKFEYMIISATPYKEAPQEMKTNDKIFSKE